MAQGTVPCPIYLRCWWKVRTRSKFVFQEAFERHCVSVPTSATRPGRPVGQLAGGCCRVLLKSTWWGSFDRYNREGLCLQSTLGTHCVESEISFYFKIARWYRPPTRPIPRMQINDKKNISVKLGRKIGSNVVVYGYLRDWCLPSRVTIKIDRGRARLGNLKRSPFRIKSNYLPIARVLRDLSRPFWGQRSQPIPRDPRESQKSRGVFETQRLVREPERNQQPAVVNIVAGALDTRWHSQSSTRGRCRACDAGGPRLHSHWYQRTDALYFRIGTPTVLQATDYIELKEVHGGNLLKIFFGKALGIL